MAFDLQKMLHRKGEFESARLDAFAFRVRARTMRFLAETLGLDPDEMVRKITAATDAAIIAALAEEFGQPLVDSSYARALADAEREAIEELGDPTPVRVA